jgi:hypothetical protein
MPVSPAMARSQQRFVGWNSNRRVRAARLPCQTEQETATGRSPAVGLRTIFSPTVLDDREREDLWVQL